VLDFPTVLSLMLPHGVIHDAVLSLVRYDAGWQRRLDPERVYSRLTVVKEWPKREGAAIP